MNFKRIILGSILALLGTSSIANSLNLKEELSFSSGIGTNLASKYLTRMDLMADNEYVVINTNIPFTNSGMTAITINYWGYESNWKTVVGWYEYNGQYYAPNAYISGIGQHDHIKLFEKNGKVAIALPKNAFSMYGSISVSKNVSGFSPSIDWQKNWTVTTHEVPDANKLQTIPLFNSGKTAPNFSNTDLTFAENRIHDLRGKNLSLMNGKVGIGTDQPESLLHLKGSETNMLVLENTGIPQHNTTTYETLIKFRGGNQNFSIGTYYAGIGNTMRFGFSNGIASMSIRDNYTIIGQHPINSQFALLDDIQLYGTIGVTKKATFYKNVDIRKELRAANSNFVVKEDGHVYATEIDVAMGPFPDYVFDQKYNLMALDSLNEYIAINKHLPNIPSQEEVKSKGIGLGELSRLQQEKIEELTLYTIQQQDLIEKLNRRLSEIENRLK